MNLNVPPRDPYQSGPQPHDMIRHIANERGILSDSVDSYDAQSQKPIMLRGFWTDLRLEGPLIAMSCDPLTEPAMPALTRFDSERIKERLMEECGMTPPILPTTRVLV